MATATAKIGAILKMADGQLVVVSEGDLITDLVYTVNGQKKMVSGRIRVINATTRTNNDIPNECPPEPYVHRFVNVNSLTIDSSEVYDADMLRINVSDISAIGKVNDSFATKEFSLNGKTYFTVEEAIADAQSGDVIKMTRNTDMVTAIPAGVTLDVMPGYTLTFPQETAPEAMASGIVKINPGANLVLNNEIIIGDTGRMVVKDGSAVTLNMTTKAISVVGGGSVKVPTGKTMFMLLDFKNGTRVGLNTNVEAGSVLMVDGVIKIPSMDEGTTFTVNGNVMIASGAMLQVAAKADVNGSGTIYNAGNITLAKASSREATYTCPTVMNVTGMIYSQLDADILEHLTDAVKSTGTYTVDGVVDGSGKPVEFKTLYSHA